MILNKFVCDGSVWYREIKDTGNTAKLQKDIDRLDTGLESGFLHTR